MDHDGDKVQQDPISFIVPGDAKSLMALFFCFYGNLIGDGPGLPGTGAGGDDKVIRRRADARQVYYRDVRAVSFMGDPCRVKRQLFVFGSRCFWSYLVSFTLIQ